MEILYQLFSYNNKFNITKYFYPSGFYRATQSCAAFTSQRQTDRESQLGFSYVKLSLTLAQLVDNLPKSVQGEFFLHTVHTRAHIR